MLLASGIEASYPQLSNDIKGLCDSAEATLHTTIEETIPDAGEVQIEPRDCPQTARGRRVDAMHIRALSRTRTRGGIPAARAVSSKPLIFSAPQPECSMSKSTKSAPEERAMRAMPWLPNSKPSARSGRLRRRAVDERGSNASQVFDAHVIVENDVNLAALGEQTSGLGRGVRDFAAIEIGAGFGAGLVLDGNLHRGARGSAGELDYIPFSAAGAPAPLDPSLGGLGRLAAARGLGSDLPSVFAAARAGDRKALTVVEAEARVLALHLAAIAAVIDVELIVLGGAVARAHGDLIVEPTRAFLAELVPIPPRVECSQLGEQAIVAGGIAVGARVALERVFSSRAASKQRVTA